MFSLVKYLAQHKHHTRISLVGGQCLYRVQFPDTLLCVFCLLPIHSSGVPVELNVSSYTGLGGALLQHSVIWDLSYNFWPLSLSHSSFHKDAILRV